MKLYKWLFSAALLLTLGFCVAVVVGWFRYDRVLNSAPFWVWIMTDALLWLLPALTALLAGCIAKKKSTEKENQK